VWEYLFIYDNGGTGVLCAHLSPNSISPKTSHFLENVKNNDDIKYTSLPCALWGKVNTAALDT
jgi:hypothetical protein